MDGGGASVFGLRRLLGGCLLRSGLLGGRSLLVLLLLAAGCGSSSDEAATRTVTVVTVSSGLKVRLAARPAAMVTIMVSPIARDTASSSAPAMPGRAAGSSTRLTVSDLVAPMAEEPSRRLCGTAFRMSSDSEETNGISMIPITAPATRAI